MKADFSISVVATISESFESQGKKWLIENELLSEKKERETHDSTFGRRKRRRQQEDLQLGFEFTKTCFILRQTFTSHIESQKEKLQINDTTSSRYTYIVWIFVYRK